MYYVQVKDDVVVNRAVFDDPMPQDWPDYDTWIQDDTAQIGWSYDGTNFVPPSSLISFDDNHIMGSTIYEIITKPGV